MESEIQKMKSDQTEQENEQYLPLRETVYNKLRRQILTGELKPGERLMEIHLANKLDVSRTPIREAIRKLENEGLVRISPRSGAQVAQISEKELKDVLEVRRSLDALAARLACERMTDMDRRKLRESCSNFEDAALEGESVAIAEADVAFHEVIIGASGNRQLADILHHLADQMYRYRFEYIKDDSNYDQLIREHRQLTEAIVSGDEETAVAVSHKHIDRQEAAILAQLRKRQTKQ